MDNPRAPCPARRLRAASSRQATRAPVRDPADNAPTGAPSTQNAAAPRTHRAPTATVARSPQRPDAAPQASGRPRERPGSKSGGSGRQHGSQDRDRHPRQAHSATILPPSLLASFGKAPQPMTEQPSVRPRRSPPAAPSDGGLPAVTPEGPTPPAHHPATRSAATSRRPRPPGPSGAKTGCCHTVVRPRAEVEAARRAAAEAPPPEPSIIPPFICPYP